MAYVKYRADWIDDDESKPADAAAFDHIETGIFDAAADADAAQVTADAAIPKAISGFATDKVPVYNGTNWVAQKIVNAQIDAAAAIAYSKLSLAGAIKDSDLATTPADAPQGTVLGYTEVTSNTSITATSLATANTVVTAPAIAFDGATPVWIEWYSLGLQRGTSNIIVVVYQDSSSLGQIGFRDVAGIQTTFGVRKLTPPSGTITYSIRAFVDAGTGILHHGTGASGANMPGFIRVVKA